VGCWFYFGAFMWCVCVCVCGQQAVLLCHCFVPTQLLQREHKGGPTVKAAGPTEKAAGPTVKRWPYSKDSYPYSKDSWSCSKGS